jgi:DnaJ-class molecular chaperone
MYIEILGLDINNISKYTKEDIKGIYKKIALECHPDKLIKTQDIKVKNAKIERFKKACIAYKKAIEDFDNYGELRAYPNSTTSGIMATMATLAILATLGTLETSGITAILI